ncbi:DUF4350 domain-containing protein [Antarcticibacterium sp. 1MA-6-2]|uniref:DUF4350 domain-containing protein n=1 Tax=Antarcticibacterium sp. 1MA-6-2 TaxID=2908210 RepID=UPI001F417DF8|nr:DUF4350 domain-containing protein [Antarcticibacterium sp. 1MA-6-2]UJH92022.1 DUF4350 domain-containing protein [Antarcticibacterium sp. 1MA-6-2]
MSKIGKIAFGLFLLLVLFLTYLEASEPQPVNWNPSYLETDKIALGSYVFYESWKENTTIPIEKIELPPFEFLEQGPTGTYFFLNNYLDFDDAELKKLLKWIESGNTVFLSAGYFGQNLLDTLKLETKTYIPGEDFTSMPYLDLVNPDLRSAEPYQYSHDVGLEYFSKIDTLKHTLLGVADLEFFKDPKDAYPVFLKSSWGKGTLYLHTFPEAFGNYFLLTNSNYRYAQGILSYLPKNETVYWDGYYKTGKTYFTSPLYVLLNNRALKWAYYFLLLGCIVFIIFEGKRKQRPVPVINPLKNQTYEYSRTIADLYLEQKDYKALAIKKIDHFNDYLRNRYRIFSNWKEDKFYKELAEKSSHTEEDTKYLFRKFQEITNKTEITKEELQDLNQKIDSYKQ